MGRAFDHRKNDFTTAPRSIKEVAHKKPETDMVNSPPHYNFGQYEVFAVLMDWFPSNPILWQVGKYLARSPHKGNTLEDLKKARWYLNKEIDRLESMKDQIFPPAGK